MSPKAPDPTVRVALIETAARIIAEHGSDGLTLRGLAREVGTSTMAVYTHFGSAADLRGAVRQEGFARLAEHLSAVEHTDDPIADLALLGLAYYRNGIENPNLYRAMFMEHLEADTDDVGLDTFDQLVAAVQRCIDDGWFRGDALPIATEVWAATHGVVSLQLAGFLDEERALLAFADTGSHIIDHLKAEAGRGSQDAKEGARATRRRR